jgi:RimJ/RimL family protein N-acetyltransferase
VGPAAGPVLATARLRLRPAGPGDVDALHALWTDAQVRRFLWDDVVIDRATAAARVSDSAASFARAGFGLWMLEPPSVGAALGVAGFVVLEAEVGPELVYAVHPAHQGRGYATEASRALLAYAFATLGLERVPGRTDTPNRASARVLERLGMRFEGESAPGGRPTVTYAITREEFARARDGAAPR